MHVREQRVGRPRAHARHFHFIGQQERERATSTRPSIKRLARAIGIWDFELGARTFRTSLYAYTRAVAAGSALASGHIRRLHAAARRGKGAARGLSTLAFYIYTSDREIPAGVFSRTPAVSSTAAAAREPSNEFIVFQMTGRVWFLLLADVL